MNTRIQHKCKNIPRKNKKIFQNQGQYRSNGLQIVCQINKTITHYFPDLIDRLKELPDYRERKQYQIAELVMGGIAMFLFKEGSRNAMNNDRNEIQFRNNYHRLFKLRLPHMDAVDDLLLILKEEELEQLKAMLVATLIEQHVFRKFKFLGKKYNITVDGSGISSFDNRHV